MNILYNLSLFALVAEHASFTAAAKAARLTASTVSTRISELERHFGIQLFYRNSRYVTLTSDGEFLRDRVDVLLRRYAKLEAGNAAKTGSSSVRILSDACMTKLVVMPAVRRLLANAPDMTVEVHHSTDDQTRMTGAFDLSVTFSSADEGGDDEDEIQLSPYRLITVAAPAYLAARAAPRHPDELSQHVCISAAGGEVGRRLWAFGEKAATQRELGANPLEIYDIEGQIEAAQMGYGVMRGPDFVLRDYLSAGSLMQILPSWDGAGPPLMAKLGGVMAGPAARNLFERLRAMFPATIPMVEAQAARAA